MIFECILLINYQAKTWVLCFGFTLAFGSMFSKTWRVHSIFTNIRMNKKAIKDYKLFFFVGLIALLDMLTLALWAFISPFSFSVIQLATIVRLYKLTFSIIKAIQMYAFYSRLAISKTDQFRGITIFRVKTIGSWVKVFPLVDRN